MLFAFFLNGKIPEFPWKKKSKMAKNAPCIFRGKISEFRDVDMNKFILSFQKLKKKLLN